jgi:hypothetical protein
VNSGGGLIWTTEISKYQAIITAFNIEILHDQFSCLKEMANLFIVKPENLKAVIMYGYLAKIEMKSIRSILELRQDWAKLAKLEKSIFSNDPGLQAF